METPVSASEAGQLEFEETKSAHQQSFSTTSEVGELFLVADSDRLAVLDTGATVNLVGFRWPGLHNRILERKGHRKVSN